MVESTKKDFNPLEHTKPKVYMLYIGVVEEDDDGSYEDLGEHRTINVLASSMEDLEGKVKPMLSDGEYFMGAVLIAVLEHSFIDRIKLK